MTVTMFAALSRLKAVALVGTELILLRDKYSDRTASEGENPLGSMLLLSLSLTAVTEDKLTAFWEVPFM
jgi:hypothetical protein